MIFADHSGDLRHSLSAELLGHEPIGRLAQVLVANSQLCCEHPETNSPPRE
jgi:hypothetical protein